MKKKTLIIIGLLFLVLVLGLILIIRKPKTTIAPTTSTTAAGLNTGPANCSGDSNCLSSNLLSCQPAIFSTDFTPPGSKYVITIYGKEGDNCHYDFKVLNADGSLVAGMDCQVPFTLISANTFRHFFNQDTGTAKDAQNKLQNTYCTTLSQK
ncbi:MAG: hypothetical protein ACP5RX_01450 [Minisyncoccia bacterium]